MMCCWSNATEYNQSDAVPHSTWFSVDLVAEIQPRVIACRLLSLASDSLAEWC